MFKRCRLSAHFLLERGVNKASKRCVSLLLVFILLTGLWLLDNIGKVNFAQDLQNIVTLHQIRINGISCFRNKIAKGSALSVTTQYLFENSIDANSVFLVPTTCSD